MNRNTFIAVAAVSIMLMGRSLSAQEVSAGWEGDNRRGYVFISPGLNVNLGPAQALVFRAAGSYLYYDFLETGGRVEVTSPGAGAAIGYRVRGRHLNATFTSGFELRQTRRTQGKGTEEATERGPYASAEVFVSAGALTRISTLANYGQANKYTWARAGVTRQLTNRRFEKARALGVGVDVTVSGNRDVVTQQIGGVLTWDWFRAAGSLQLRGGYSRSVSSGVAGDQHPYVGAGLYRRF